MKIVCCVCLLIHCGTSTKKKTTTISSQQPTYALTLDDPSIVADANLFLYGFYTLTAAANPTDPTLAGNYLQITFSSVDRCSFPGKPAEHADIVLVTPNFGPISAGTYKKNTGNLSQDASASTTLVSGSIGSLQYFYYDNTCLNNASGCRPSIGDSSSLLILKSIGFDATSGKLTGYLRIHTPDLLTGRYISGNFTATFCPNGQYTWN